MNTITRAEQQRMYEDVLTRALSKYGEASTPEHQTRWAEQGVWALAYEASVNKHDLQLTNIIRSHPNYHEYYDFIRIEVDMPSPDVADKLDEDAAIMYDIITLWSKADPAFKILHLLRELFIVPYIAPSDIPALYPNELALLEHNFPGAYKPPYTKKRSRVLRHICKQLGVDVSPSLPKFAQQFATISNLLNPPLTRQTLYISNNPAYILTASNPKHDKRGDTLVSCHSLNEYIEGYPAGAAQLAISPASLVVFSAKTLADVFDRKTLRCLFFARLEDDCDTPAPLLLQSRVYTTRGGLFDTPETRRMSDWLAETVINTLSLGDIFQVYEPAHSSRVGIELPSVYIGYGDWEDKNKYTKLCYPKSELDPGTGLLRIDYPSFELAPDESPICLMCGGSITTDNTGSICDECAQQFSSTSSEE